MTNDPEGLQALPATQFLERIHTMPIYEAILETEMRREHTLMQMNVMHEERHNLLADGVPKSDRRLQTLGAAILATGHELGAIATALKTLRVRSETMNWVAGIREALGEEALARVLVWRAQRELEHHEPERAASTRKYIAERMHLLQQPWQG